MSSTPRPQTPVRTTQPVAPATFSQWPHQRPTQKNRNDRLFIIAQPLCRRGKSIIKTRLTAKITAVSSIVSERANFFFFFPQGSLDQSGITLVQFAPHLKSHCLLELDLPDSFTQWMDSPSSEKRRDSVWNCLRSRRVLDSSGTALWLPLTFQQEGCPHYRSRGLGGGPGGWSQRRSQTLKQGRVRGEDKNGNATSDSLCIEWAQAGVWFILFHRWQLSVFSDLLKCIKHLAWMKAPHSWFHWDAAV